jgi:uncharacterized Ntn-hydrolase superfamily protein
MAALTCDTCAMRLLLILFCAIALDVTAAAPPHPSTFSIVAADPETGEVGVAVASKFFAVGAVVPYAKAGVGAAATQAMANVTYGPRSLELLQRGLSAEEVVKVLTRPDDDRDRRQFGVVAANGESATFTGSKANVWAGGRRGPNYAVQGNILTGEDVVVAMEKAFVQSHGKRLAERLYLALIAGEAKGGDSRGKQSASLLVARDKGGFLGLSDRAVDIRVDDHAEPFVELGRLLSLALLQDEYAQAMRALTDKRYAAALPAMERVVALAEKQPSVLPGALYNLACVRALLGDLAGARQALDRSIALDPQFKTFAETDPDLAALR